MINSFKNYLVEEEKTIYFTFGRMNPPTIGHEKLLDALSKKAAKNPYRVFLSQSQDPKKNPLQYKDKVKMARKMFPRHARAIMLEPKVKSVFDAVTKLYNEGYKNIVMIVGSDRVREFDILLNKYNGKKAKHGLYNFSNINVISAGARDPDAEGVEGMSASKMRTAASDGDFAQFSQGIPKAIGNADTKKIYNAVRSGMGLKEQREFKNHVQLEPVSGIRESYIDGTLFEKGETVVIKENGVVGKIKHLGTNYIILESKGETYRKWLHQVEKVDPSLPISYDIAPHSYGKISETLNTEDLNFANFSTQAETVTLADLEEKKNPEDPDIGDRKGSQPVNYHAGLKKSTKIARDRQFKKQAKMSDDDPSAYKPAPGDKTAKTRPSKHTLKFKQMFGDNVDYTDIAKKRIDREKKADAVRHDRMMDRARLRDTRKKNKETK